MRIACWIRKATDAHSECVILTAFPRQQCLHERASVLRYTYIASIVIAKTQCVVCFYTVRTVLLVTVEINFRLS
jgi:hypothetical protein